MLFFHDLGHLFFIRFFKYKINKITFYPFGGLILYECKNDSIFRFFLISVGGVLVNLLLFIFFNFIGNKLLADINLFFILINLIPINPLDGAKILLSGLKLIFPYKMSKKIIYLISLILSILIFIFVFIKFKAYIYLFMLLIFLRLNVSNLSNINKEYHDFLLSKYLYPNPNLKIRRTRFWTNNPINNFFYGYNMLFDYDNLLLDEKRVLNDVFENKKEFTF